ncbi:MAG: PDZ domain-containing protein, partial [Oscillospiraceae bacterium]|nr:PDZ domain-containing protein [Oscillospiraceae bacterium]
MKIRRSLAALAAFIIITSAVPGALAVMPTELVPVGRTVGIEIKCEGVMVVALGQVETETGAVAPAARAGILPGDVITQVGETKIHSSAQLKAALADAGGQTVTIRVTRDPEQKLHFSLTPAKDMAGNY